jgi:hypothetical protein
MQAKVEMGDTAKPGPSIQSIIDKAVSACLKSAPVKKGRGAKKVSCELMSPNYPSNMSQNINGKRGKKFTAPTPKKTVVEPKLYQPKAGHRPPRATKMEPKSKDKRKGKGKKST